jgi:hypothetical protein
MEEYGKSKAYTSLWKRIWYYLPSGHRVVIFVAIVILLSLDGTIVVMIDHWKLMGWKWCYSTSKVLVLVQQAWCLSVELLNKTPSQIQKKHLAYHAGLPMGFSGCSQAEQICTMSMANWCMPIEESHMLCCHTRDMGNSPVAYCLY